jgi:c-di-GMP-binding flagellar brake protein YcgR
MNERTSADRRKYVRYPLATTVQFYHCPSRREVPARSVDISSGGILVYVPAGTPVAPGQPVQLRLGTHKRPEFALLSNRPLDGTIVRVDRNKMMSVGHLPVGVRFSEPVE